MKTGPVEIEFKFVIPATNLLILCNMRAQAKPENQYSERRKCRERYMSANPWYLHSVF